LTWESRSKLSINTYGIKADIINLNDYSEAQDSPCPFGTFGIVYQGKIMAYHPISGTRFNNMMKKELTR
jgi:hypothetical protein